MKIQSREGRAKLAQETLQILNQGYYINAKGQKINIQKEIKESVEKARFIPPDEYLFSESSIVSSPENAIVEEIYPTQISVEEKSSLQAAKDWWDQGIRRILLLNFASATNPGGGFLVGANAQEESLARSSSLFATLVKFQKEFYDLHKVHKAPYYSHAMILSPSVVVFRNHEGDLLEKPYFMDILTAPAVNCYTPEAVNPEKVQKIMKTRAGKILKLVSSLEYTHLILGAWGCGAFRNSPEMVAQIFGDLLLPPGPFYGMFRKISFAIIDPSKEKRNLLSFQHLFSS
ncbi:MAG: TIGR02452 family protein [Planctomycetota bacterium]|nr:MAG: TIGR02452 family protein [Planctomycetota bacterium]